MIKRYFKKDQRSIKKKDNLSKIICPVCGYYCLGKGGVGCIDKPNLINVKGKIVMESKIEKRITLILSEKEAEWLKRFVQNPIYINGFCNEDEEDSEMRKKIFDCLSDFEES